MSEKKSDNPGSGDIAQIISGVNPNKVHGHDMISIHMVKIYGESICKPLEFVFGTSLNNKSFPLK